jgi:hypothetical protein
MSKPGERFGTGETTFHKKSNDHPDQKAHRDSPLCHDRDDSHHRLLSERWNRCEALFESRGGDAGECLAGVVASFRRRLKLIHVVVSDVDLVPDERDDGICIAKGLEIPVESVG